MNPTANKGQTESEITMYESIKTPADLDALPTPVIVDLYNKLTGKTIKGFHTRGKGIEQTFKALQSQTVTKEETVLQPEKKAVITAPVTQHKRAGRAGRIDPNAVIEILQEENPKRPGSRSFDQYRLLLSFDGKLVSEFIETAEEMLESAPKGWTRAELIWCEKKGFIAPITKG